VVELLEFACHVREALALRVSTRTFRLALAELRVLGETRNFGAGELGLLARSRRGGDRAPRRRCFEPHSLEPVERRDEDARLPEQLCSRSTVARGSDVHAVTQQAWDRRPAGQRLRAQQDELPFGQLLQRAKHAAQESALVRPPLEHDQVALLPGVEELGLEALADDAVATGEADCRCLGRLLVGRDQRVDTAEQAVALRASRRVAEPFRVQERRDGHGLCVTQGEIRE